MKEFSQEEYEKLYVAADRRFSIVPTMLLLSGDLKGKTVLDIGCGDGFLTKHLAEKGAKKVIGLDISKEQISIAKKKNSASNIEYKALDVFKQKLPEADEVIAMFVLGSLESKEELNKFFKKVYDHLPKGGKFVAVLDYPEKGADLKKFGAVKSFMGKEEDGAKIRIVLYQNEKPVVSLKSHYFSQLTVRQAALGAGFSKFLWKPPIISSEGIKKYGSVFWKDYVQNPGLGYFWAQKL